MNNESKMHFNKQKIIFKTLIFIIFSFALSYSSKSNCNSILEFFPKNNCYDFNIDCFNINQNINNNTIYSLLKTEKKTEIENIFLLIGIMPFLLSNRIIIKQKTKSIYELFKYIFTIKKIKNKDIIISEKDFYNFKKKLKNLLYNKWDSFPDFSLINIIRYIINNYYDEISLSIFDKSLNLNLKNFIKINYLKLSSNFLTKVMSKINIYFNFFRK